MRTTNDANGTKMSFKEMAANAVSRYLIGTAEKSIKVSGMFNIYEPKFPIDLLKESCTESQK